MDRNRNCRRRGCRSRADLGGLCLPCAGERLSYAEAHAHAGTFGKYGAASPVMGKYLELALEGAEQWDRKHKAKAGLYVV